MSYATIGNATIDRMVAERLGWHPEQLETGWRWRKGDMKWTAPERLYGTAEGVFEWLYDNEVIPHYSDDLNAAWILTEPYCFKLVPLYTGAGKVGCIAELSDANGRIGKGEAITPALAICLAWLMINDDKVCYR